MPISKEDHLLLLEAVELGHRGRGANLQHAEQREQQHKAKQDPIEISKSRANHSLSV
jgi:hypothetical protein